jgi:hypothetical protein
MHIQCIHVRFDDGGGFTGLIAQCSNQKHARWDINIVPAGRIVHVFFFSQKMEKEGWVSIRTAHA